MINVFIPHRWKYNDYEIISALLDRTKFEVKNYSVPEIRQLDKIDRRYNVDPQIKNRIDLSSVIIVSNRPGNSNGMTLDEVKYAHSKGKPIVAIRIVDNCNHFFTEMGIEVIPCRKDSLDNWIYRHLCL